MMDEYVNIRDSMGCTYMKLHTVVDCVQVHKRVKENQIIVTENKDS